LDLKINSVANVVEKGFETRVTIAFSGFFVSFIEPGQKRQNLIRGDGLQFPIAKFI
jgi:hypothetical protein